MGVFTVYSADSDLLIESEEGATNPIDPVVESLETEMIGRFGAGLGYQRFLADDFSINLGLEGRYTATKVTNPPLAPPNEETPVFAPGDVLQFQASLGSRWWLPTRWGHQGRVRPFIGLDLNYIPETNFDVVATIIDNPDTGMLLQDSFEFTGSPYWTLGLCLGLSYQWSDDVVVHLTVFHETALTESESVNSLDVQLPPPSPPDLIPPLQTTTTVDAGGWIGFLSVSWGF
jgi:hypothetical protein